VLVAGGQGLRSGPCPSGSGDCPTENKGVASQLARAQGTKPTPTIECSRPSRRSRFPVRSGLIDEGPSVVTPNDNCAYDGDCDFRWFEQAASASLAFRRALTFGRTVPATATCEAPDASTNSKSPLPFHPSPSTFLRLRDQTTRSGA